jgi:hypothetical protein
MMLAMSPIYDPVQLRHPNLLEFAIHAAWISTVAAAQRDLEDLLIDVPPEERELPDSARPGRGSSIRSSSRSRSSRRPGKPQSRVSRS